jgi:hypothetical protein
VYEEDGIERHGDIVGVMSTHGDRGQLRKTVRYARLVLHTILALPVLLVLGLLYLLLTQVTALSLDEILSLGVLAIMPMYAMMWCVTSETQRIFLATCIGKGVPVELIDFEGDRYYSIASPVMGNDSMEAFNYWYHEVGHVMLRSDGTAGPGSMVIDFWLPLRKRDRIEHMLRNDLPDFDQLFHLDPVARPKMIRDLARQYKSGFYAT